jgi:hypothetical protein
MQERPQDDTPAPQQWPAPPSGPSKRNRNAGRNVLIVAAVAIAAIVAIGLSNRPGNSPAAGADTTPSQPALGAATDPGLPPGTPADSPSPMPSPVATTVTYACTGSAPDGVDITYGPSGSNFSATSLPFNKTVPFDSGAQYYVTTAQLQGSGSVSCTTTVVWNGAGGGSTAVNTGSASGGYNIASAQVCSSFTGAWEKC